MISHVILLAKLWDLQSLKIVQATTQDERIQLTYKDKFTSLLPSGK